jgi:hypothetical protein
MAVFVGKGGSGPEFFKKSPVGDTLEANVEFFAENAQNSASKPLFARKSLNLQTRQGSKPAEN